MTELWGHFVRSLATEAGAILMRHFNRSHQVTCKRGAGIVTEADKAAERFLVRNIFRKFPNSSIITEESGEFRRSSSLCWVIDPLDGTSNYAHGFPWFCVSIGLYEEERPVAGVVYHPVNREMFFAETGCGAWLNEKRIYVSGNRRLERALLGTGFYYARGEKLRREMELFRRMNEVALGVRRPGAAALDLAYVACGRYDGFWERGLSPWDVAAGLILVAEAGGKFSNFKGLKTTIFDREILATNGRLHSKMIKVLHERKLRG